MLEVRVPDTPAAKHPLRGHITRVGRGGGEAVEILVDQRSVSRHHFSLERREDGFWLVDAGRNRNGTVVNGKRVKEVRLRDGDRIAAGEVEMMFHDAGFDSLSPATQIAGTATPPPPSVRGESTVQSSVILDDRQLAKTLATAAVVALAAVAGLGLAISLLGS